MILNYIKKFLSTLGIASLACFCGCFGGKLSVTDSSAPTSMGRGTSAGGFVGSLTITANSSCYWTNTIGAFTNFATTNSNCLTAVVSGAASPPTEGSIPAVLFKNLASGNYELNANIQLYSSNASGCTFRLWDGTQYSDMTWAESLNSLHGQFAYSTDQTNIEFYVQSYAYSNTCTLDDEYPNLNMVEIWLTKI